MGSHVRRGQILFVVLALLSASLIIAPARASDPIVADAGDSMLTYGEPLWLSGLFRGGIAPYDVAWSWPGDAGRIANASSLAATFDPSDLGPQDIVFTLTVTDAHGDVAIDTVRHRVDLAPILVRRELSITFGLPDELVTSSTDVRTSFFTPPPGLARLVATLSWPEQIVNNDLDLALADPSGAIVSGGQGATSNNPEVVTITAPVSGRWTARVEPFLSAPTNATLTVQGFPLGSRPSVSAGGPYTFGRLDPQALLATATGGAAPLTFAWDTDGDGVFESTGAAITSALPEGTHTVRVRVTDAVGFEVSGTTTVDVRAADTILRLRCGNDDTTPYWTMEFTSSKGSCWIHGGHHTYFMGDTHFALRALSGFVFTVEQQLSPPTEHQTDAPGATPLHLQVSDDGITWSELTHGEYRFLPNVAEGQTAVEERQRVDISATADGVPFRFLRIHEPLSAAQGLSGYLDHSQFDIEADVLGAIPAPVVVPRERTLTCNNDIMESFFVAHPCWFGGIDRWDAASFWHTYPLGDGSTISRLRGQATVAPWRLDDWTAGNATANGTSIAVRLQTSVDGMHWDDVALLQGYFGVPLTFGLTLDDTEARFVRFFPEYHARFDQTAEFAPNHHAKAYLIDSTLIVNGLGATEDA